MMFDSSLLIWYIAELKDYSKEKQNLAWNYSTKSNLLPLLNIDKMLFLTRKNK